MAWVAEEAGIRMEWSSFLQELLSFGLGMNNGIKGSGKDQEKTREESGQAAKQRKEAEMPMAGRKLLRL